MSTPLLQSSGPWLLSFRPFCWSSSSVAEVAGPDVGEEVARRAAEAFEEGREDEVERGQGIGTSVWTPD